MAIILIVDDEESILLNLSAYIEDDGFQIISATSGEHALALIESEKPDVGIIDMRLPGMDGNELIIRAAEINPDMQFIVHTGSSDYLLPPELLKIGIDTSRIYKKPIADMAVFTQAIRDLITKKSGEDTASGS